jgi:hypothetical protein
MQYGYPLMEWELGRSISPDIQLNFAVELKVS